MVAPEIATDRLTIGALRQDDAASFFRYRSAPAVSRFQSWAPRSLAEAMEFVAGFRRVEFGAPDSWFQLAIRLASSGALVGDIGVHFLVAESRQAEIGFTIAPLHQRHGYATEAVQAVIGYLFRPLDKHRVIASVDPRNEPSMALLRRVGMRQEAHFKQSLWFKGEWVDDVVFAVLKSEWVNASDAS